MRSNRLTRLYTGIQRYFDKAPDPGLAGKEDLIGQELKFHLEESVQRLIEQGHPPSQARRLARVRFGSIDDVKERVRDEYRFAGLRESARDLKVALRSLRGNPLFSLLVILSFGVAVAASVASWSAVQSLLVWPLLDSHNRGLVMIWGRNLEKGQLRDVISGPNYLDLRDGNHVFQALGAFKGREGNLREADHPRVVAGIEATPELFEVLGTSFRLGGGFNHAQLSQDPDLVVISHRLWMEHFGGSSRVIGGSLPMLRGSFKVVGVLPSDFSFLLPVEVVFPLHEKDLRGQDRTSINYFAIGRLLEDVSTESAQQAVAVLMSQIVEKDPRAAGWTLAVEEFRANLTEYLRVPLLLTLGSALLMLVILIFNTSNLFLARAVTRRTETAVRFALGGSRWRVLRQLMGEAIVLGVIGCGVGLIGADWILGLIGLLLPSQIPIPGSASMASRAPLEVEPLALLLALCCSVLPLLGVSLIAFYRDSKMDLVPGLKGADPTGRSGFGSPFRSSVISAEVALATVLIAVTGLVWSRTSELLRVNPGFDSGSVLTLYFGELNDRGVAERARYYELVIDSVRGVQGVESVALNDYVPLQQEDDFEGFHLADQAPSRENSFRVEWRRISPDYLITLKIPLVAGRFISDQDLLPGRSSVVVINRAMAERYWPGQDPIGRRIVVHDDHYGLSEIIGVVGDVRRRGLDREAPPVLYVPYHLNPRPVVALFARTSSDPGSMLGSVQEAIWAVDPHQPVYDAEPLTEVVQRSLTVPRLVQRLMGILALLSLTVAALGIYSMLVYRVQARRREIGVRVALGAAPRQILSMLLRSSLRTGLFGLAIGLSLASVIHGWVDQYLYGSSSPMPYVVALGVMVGAILLASAGPALAAARSDPQRVLQGGRELS